MFYQPNLVTQFKRWREQGKEELEAVCQQIAIYINPTNQEASRVYSIVCGVYQLPMVKLILTTLDLFAFRLKLILIRILIRMRRQK